MKFCLIACYFLSALPCFAQLTFEKLSVTSFCGTLKPQPVYDAFLQQPFVWRDSLQWNGCIASSGDTLFTGVLKDSIAGRSTVLTAYDSGQPTGEQLVQFTDSITGMFFVRYYTGPAAGNWKVVPFNHYNNAGVLIAKGFAKLPDCPDKSFENFFGEDDPDGRYTTYYDNGQLKTEHTMRGGHYHGNRDTYYPNGQLKEHCFYSLGFPAGTWERYSEKGKRLERITFKNGKGRGSWTD